MVADSRDQRTRLGDLAWRVFALVAAVLAATAAFMPDDAHSSVSLIVRWLGATVLLTVVYSYIASIRRR